MDDKRRAYQPPRPEGKRGQRRHLNTIKLWKEII